MTYGFTADELEDLLTERHGHLLGRATINAIAEAIAVNNERLATDIQRKIDSVLEEIIH